MDNVLTALTLTSTVLGALSGYHVCEYKGFTKSRDKLALITSVIPFAALVIPLFHSKTPRKLEAKKKAISFTVLALGIAFFTTAYGLAIRQLPKVMACNDVRAIKLESGILGGMDPIKTLGLSITRLSNFQIRLWNKAHTSEQCSAKVQLSDGQSMHVDYTLETRLGSQLYAETVLCGEHHVVNGVCTTPQ